MLVQIVSALCHTTVSFWSASDRISNHRYVRTLCHARQCLRTVFTPFCTPYGVSPQGVLSTSCYIFLAKNRRGAICVRLACASTDSLSLDYHSGAQAIESHLPLCSHPLLHSVLEANFVQFHQKNKDLTLIFLP